METNIVDVEVVISPETVPIEYVPDPIDEYLVIVNMPEDWEIVHNYIIEENEIDGIPNRQIPCTKFKEYSLRASIYEMSIEEAEVLRTHPKVESVELNPEKYPQPQSLMTDRFRKVVAFNKPRLTAALDSESTAHTNGIRSNWSMNFANQPSSLPYRGVGIITVSIYNQDIQYSLTGNNVDAVTIDSGAAVTHPEFLNSDGTTRMKDLILDGPYKVDKAYFDNNGLTYTKIIDGLNCGTSCTEAAARSWWSNTSNRSAAFSSLGTVTIPSTYTAEQAHSKNASSNPITSGHGTACASQIGGKSFGLAFESNLWTIRISLGSAGGVLGSNVAVDACTIFHNAKKISQSGDPDPTILNNSYGITSSTGNTSNSTYNIGYRGNTLTYTGTGSDTDVPANGGSARNHKQFTVNVFGFSQNFAYNGSGQYNGHSTSSNSAAEDAIAAGVIVVSSAGNTNQKLSDKDDVDFDNWYVLSSIYINRCGGIQRGFSGDHTVDKGVIRVGALDCSVEPADQKQGSTAYAIRKVCYSANGPMIDIWAPGEQTMAAGYSGSYENYPRADDSNFYDTWFNGTSAAGPNAASLLCLYLETNRKANQADVKNWMKTSGSSEIALSDPYPGINDTEYWSVNYNSTYDMAGTQYDSYNVRGNGNLRGATKRVIHNPYANNTRPAITNGASISGVSFKQI